MIDQYDDLIKSAAAQYMPDSDWRLLKAQLQAESALNPMATSEAGAMGIAQFMPKTWGEMKKDMDMPEDASPYNYGYAIPASAYYMSKLNSQWTAPRPDADRYCLALASYNAGFGNLLKAQRNADGVTDYKSIIDKLPTVTGRHAKETTDYVKRIFRTWGEYIYGGR